MALWKGRSEHGGHKGSGRKDGFWGKRTEAKESSKKQRRGDDKAAERDFTRRISEMAKRRQEGFEKDQENLTQDRKNWMGW